MRRHVACASAGAITGAVVAVMLRLSKPPDATFLGLLVLELAVLAAPWWEQRMRRRIERATSCVCGLPLVGSPRRVTFTVPDERGRPLVCALCGLCIAGHYQYRIEAGAVDIWAGWVDGAIYHRHKACHDMTRVNPIALGHRP